MVDASEESAYLIDVEVIVLKQSDFLAAGRERLAVPAELHHPERVHLVLHPGAFFEQGGLE